MYDVSPDNFSFGESEDNDGDDLEEICGSRKGIRF